MSNLKTDDAAWEPIVPTYEALCRQYPDVVFRLHRFPSISMFSVAWTDGPLACEVQPKFDNIEPKLLVQVSQFRFCPHCNKQMFVDHNTGDFICHPQRRRIGERS